MDFKVICPLQSPDETYLSTAAPRLQATTMGVSITITCSRLHHRPAELRLRDDQISRRSSRPLTPHPSGLYPVQQPLEYAHFRPREFLTYRYVSERRVYRYCRTRHAEADAADRRKASVEHRSTAHRIRTQQVEPSDKQDLQKRKAEQNAKIQNRPGAIDKKPEKKVRFESDDLTRAVGNLRLDERSGEPRQFVRDPDRKAVRRRGSTIKS